MKKIKHIFFITLVLLLTSCQTQAANNTEITNVDITSHMNAFHNQLFTDVVTHDDTENPMISSLSAYFALLTCMQGANGETKAEIMDVLQVKSDQAELLIRSIHSTLKDVPLQIKDGFFHADDITIKPSFSTFLNNISAEAIRVDFKTADAQEQISAWISKQTNQAITPTLTIPKTTKAVIVNTLVTQNQWMNDVNMISSEGYFMSDDDDQMRTIDVIKTTYHTQVTQNDDYHAAKLPMKDDMYVYFVLPNEQTPRELLVKYPSLLQDIQKGETEKEVYFSIPKFHIDKTLDLTPSLKRMGMKQAFQENADFTNMIKQQPFMLSTIQQSSMFKINEVGVEAASATIIGITGVAEQREDIMDLYLDHPFLYYVTYEKDDLVIPLFTGIYDTPMQLSDR